MERASGGDRAASRYVPSALLSVGFLSSHGVRDILYIPAVCLLMLCCMCRRGWNGGASCYNDADSSWPGDSDTELGGSGSDFMGDYTGMPREDISRQLSQVVGSTVSSSRAYELNTMCGMVYELRELQKQEALLQSVCSNKARFTGSRQLVRGLTCLLWSGGSFGSSDHNAAHCPTDDNAAAATPDLVEAKRPAGTASTRPAAGKKFKKQSENAANAANAEKASTDGSMGKTDGEPGAASANSIAARPDGAVAKASEQRARANSRARAATAQLATMPKATHHDEGRGAGTAGSDDDLESLVSAYVQRKGQAGAKAGITILPPAVAKHPHRSPRADAADAAAVCSGGNSGAANAMNDTEQPEQKHIFLPRPVVAGPKEKDYPLGNSGADSSTC